MTNRRTLILLMSISSVAVFFLAACSSAPKGPQYVYARANEAADLCQLGRKALRVGDTVGARAYYREAYRLYTLVDDAEGRIRSLDGLAILGDQESSGEDEAVLAKRIAADYRDNGSDASIAEHADYLEALATLIEVRSHYLSGAPDAAALRSARSSLAAALPALQSRPDDRARALRLDAELAAAMGEYSAALLLLEEAAAIWSKPLSLVEYANTRYLAASALSRMGRYDEAYAALLDAFDHDRKAENSMGLAETCHALALVSRKRGDEALAERWERRSRDVYRALSLLADAAPAGIPDEAAGSAPAERE